MTRIEYLRRRHQELATPLTAISWPVEDARPVIADALSVERYADDLLARFEAPPLSPWRTFVNALKGLYR